MKLLLIFRNISKLIKSQRILLIFLVMSQIVACLAIFFSVGAIHNTHNEQKDIDIRTMYFEIYIEPITLGEMQRKSEYIISLIPENMLLYANIRGKVNGISYQAQMITDDEIEREHIKNSEKVVDVRESFPPNPSDPKVNDTIEIFGNEYTVISVDDYVTNYIIPITALDSDLPASRLRITLNSVPEKAIANEIQKAISEVFPVTTESHVPEIPDLVSMQFNRTMIVTSAIVIVIVVLNLSYCYCYLFIQRKKMLSVYMMCGSSNSTAANLMITEAIIISVVCYLISICLIKPFTSQISEIYPAAEMLYSVKFFAIVGAVYITLTAIILKIMFSTLLKKSAVELKRGA